MKIAAYTSCSLNYLAKAKALAASIKRNSPNTTLTLCFCDEFDGRFKTEAGDFARIWQPEHLGYENNWIFQHNIMELCTAVKGRALLKLLAEEPEADLFVYLDPDVYVYNDLAIVGEYLEGSSIGLVPHILTPEKSDLGVRLTEVSVAEHGIYNLGHLFVKPDSNGRALAEWWTQRLDSFCFDDKTIGLFTDQRWMDLAPSLFEGVKILRVPNLDVASWNIAYRDIIQTKAGDERSFTVDGWPLITYHFSGTGPSGTHKRIREIFAPTSGAAAEIERLYENEIGVHGQLQLADIPPVFDFFENGEKVPQIARKLYREHADLQLAFPNPFACDQKVDSYYNWLLERHPGLFSGFVVPKVGLEKAFDDLFDDEYYLSAYLDARDSIENGEYKNALDHYINVGSSLLYDPCEFFVSRFYIKKAKYLDGYSLRALPRTKKSTILWHYLTIGLPQGIEAIEYFDSQFYISENEDIKMALRTGVVSSPLAHFMKSGARESRKPSLHFNYDAFSRILPAVKPSDNGLFSVALRCGYIGGRCSSFE